MGSNVSARRSNESRTCQVIAKVQLKAFILAMQRLCSACENLPKFVWPHGIPAALPKTSCHRQHCDTSRQTHRHRHNNTVTMLLIVVNTAAGRTICTLREISWGICIWVSNTPQILLWNSKQRTACLILFAADRCCVLSRPCIVCDHAALEISFYWLWNT